MGSAAATPDQRKRELSNIAVVLLLVQAVFALVGAAGMVAIGLTAGFPVATPAGLIVVLNVVAPAVLAVGVARGRGWAWRGAIVFESLTLLTLFINLLLVLLPQVQMELTLTGLLSGAALPVAVIGLLRAAEDRSGFRVPSGPAATRNPEPGTRN
jgi:hypothetical protein